MASDIKLTSLKLLELRAKCKEVIKHYHQEGSTESQLKILNYSKLNKAQLIERLQAHQVLTPATPTENTATATKRKSEPEQSKIRKKSAAVGTAREAVSPPILDTSNTAATGPPIASQPSNAPPPPCASTPVTTKGAAPLKAPKTAFQFSPTKRVASSIHGSNKNKKVVLVSTRPLSAVTTPQENPRPTMMLETEQQRVAFIERHWLDRLWRQLHANRRSPILTSPFPGAGTGITAHLAFQGLHADIYKLRTDAFLVAVRFWIARLHTMLQLGSLENCGAYTSERGLFGPDFSLWPQVKVCERLNGPLWRILAGEHYLVFDDIGEVLARGEDETRLRETIRIDWQDALSADRGSELRIHTKDDFDFPDGVRRAWSLKAPPEAKAVARRAVLSSCVLNRWTCSGGVKLPAAKGVPPESWSSISQSKLILAWLKERPHQVVSVHMGGDISYVQRGSGFSDVVLSETGQIIGNEDGVGELWQGLLGCNARGKPFDSGFWKDWESRMAG